MNKENLESFVQLEIDQNLKSTMSRVSEKIQNINNVQEFTEQIKLNYSEKRRYEKFDLDILYKYLIYTKKIAQLYLNLCNKENKFYLEKCMINKKAFIMNDMFIDSKYIENIEKSQIDEEFLIKIISYYIIIHSLLLDIETESNKELCIICDSVVENDKCTICEYIKYNSVTTKILGEVKSHLDHESGSDIQCVDKTFSIDNFNTQEREKTKINENKSESFLSYVDYKLMNDSKIKNRDNSDRLSTETTDLNFNKKENNDLISNSFTSEEYPKVNKSNHKSKDLSERKDAILLNENISQIDNVEIIDEDHWICEECTFKNKNSAALCEICFHNNKNEPNELELPEERWRCHSCGNNNSFDIFKCKICGESAEFFNKWVCKSCSYYNDKLSSLCEVCDTKNPHLIKCSKCLIKFVNKQDDSICNNCKNVSGIVDDRKQKKCNKCKCPMSNNLNWCDKCKTIQWFCQNKNCNVINFQNEYCKNCKVLKDSDLSNYKNFWVLSKNNKIEQNWQCGFCLQLVFHTLPICSSCKNPRKLYIHIKCKCGWNNEKFKICCKNCSEILSKSRKI